MNSIKIRQLKAVIQVNYH